MMKLLKKSIATLAVCAFSLGGLTAASIVVAPDAAFAKNGNGGGNGGGNGNGGGSAGKGGQDKSSKGAKGNSDRGGNKNSGGSKRASKGKGNGFFKDLKKAFQPKNKRNASGGYSIKKTSAAPKTRKQAQVTEAAVTTSSRPALRPKPNGNGAIASELKGLNAAHASAQAYKNADPNSQVGRIAAYATALLEGEQAEANLVEKANLLEELGVGRTPEEIQAEIDAIDPDDETLADTLAALETELNAAEKVAEEIETLKEEIAALEEEIETQADVTGDALLAATGGRELSDEALNAFHSLIEGKVTLEADDEVSDDEIVDDESVDDVDLIEEAGDEGDDDETAAG